MTYAMGSVKGRAREQGTERRYSVNNRWRREGRREGRLGT